MIKTKTLSDLTPRHYDLTGTALTSPPTEQPRQPMYHGMLMLWQVLWLANVFEYIIIAQLWRCVGVRLDVG